MNMFMNKLPRHLWALCTLCVIMVLLAGSAFAQDTWTDVERIVAVGDVHGDFDQFVRTLRAAKVINEKNDWIAGKTHLVQIGDVLDRGPDSRKAMDLLMKLEKQAPKVGGAAHALIGNHEAMVLLGDLRYVSTGEREALGGIDGFRKAMSPKGKYGKWICTHNTVIKINDLVFVHAGLTPRFARKSLSEINVAVRRELEKGEGGIASNSGGPLWSRALALGDEDKVSEQLKVVLKRYDANRMVVGHTVSTDGVFARAGDRLIRIDVGMSGCYEGPAACLVVENGVFYEVRHPDKKRRLLFGKRKLLLGAGVALVIILVVLVVRRKAKDRRRAEAGDLDKVQDTLETRSELL